MIYSVDNWNKEKYLEKQLVKRITTQKGQCIKLIGVVSGLPDRLVLMPGGVAVFVELKSNGKRLRPLQLYWKNIIEKLGFKYFIIHDYESFADTILYTETVSRKSRAMGDREA